MSSLIILSEYHESWISDFNQEAQLIRANFRGSSIKLHHVGSTAIPGIRSKPIIDINVESDEFPPDSATSEKLRGIGYINRGTAGVDGRYWFVKGEPRKYHLHWCRHNSEVTLAQTKFRDKLTVDNLLANEYEQLKLAAADNKTIDSSDYAIAKSAFVKKVLASLVN